MSLLLSFLVVFLFCMPYVPLSDVRCPTDFPFIFLSLLLYSSVVFWFFMPGVPLTVVQRPTDLSFCCPSLLLFSYAVFSFCLSCVLLSDVRRPNDLFCYFVTLVSFVQHLCLPFGFWLPNSSLSPSRCEFFILYLRLLESDAQCPVVFTIILVLTTSAYLSNCWFSHAVVLTVCYIYTVLEARLPITFRIPSFMSLFPFCTSYVCKATSYVR